MSEKQREILIKSLSWFIALFILVFIGVNNVFGATITDYSTKYYWYVSNNNSSTTSTEYRTGSSNKVTLNGAYAPTYDNGEGFNGFYNKINYSLTKGNIYTLSLALSFSSLLQGEFNTNTIQDRLLSTSFAHCSDCTITAVSGSTRTYNSTNQSISGLYDYVVQMSYTFVATSNASTWYIGSYTGDDRTLGVDNHLYNSIVMVNNLEISNDNSSTIINQNDTIINQNQQMIDQNNQNTQNIIDSNTQSTQDIINNNDTNTNKIIDDNKKNFQNCRESVNLFDKNNVVFVNKKILNDSGQEINDSTGGYTKMYIEVVPNTEYTISGLPTSGSKDIYYFDSNKTYIGHNGYFGGTSRTFETPSNCKYIDIMYYIKGNDFNTYQLEKGTTATKYEAFGEEICTNKLDEQNKTSKGILGKLKDLFDNLFSNDDADISGLNNMVGWLPPGPVDSIINLPLSFFNSLTDTLTGTCRAVSLNIPFVNQTLVLPCFDAYMSQYLTGFNTLWTFVGVTLSVFILYYYLLSLYKWVDDTLTFRENNMPGYYGDNWGGGA